MTNRFAIFFVGSIMFGNMLPMLLGTRTISQQIHFDPATPLQIVVCDLATLREVRRFETTPGAVIHFGNAFEDGEEIVIDAMFTDNFVANDTLGKVFDPHGRFGGGRYVRYFLDMTNGHLRNESMTDVESEFPTYNLARTGQRHQACYTACSIDNGVNSFFNGSARRLRRPLDSRHAITRLLWLGRCSSRPTAPRARTTAICSRSSRRADSPQRTARAARRQHRGTGVLPETASPYAASVSRLLHAARIRDDLNRSYSFPSVKKSARGVNVGS